ncbi:MAG: hypothetical protein AB4206_20125 [Xenococcaceae cyanobacterium]
MTYRDQLEEQEENKGFFRLNSIPITWEFLGIKLTLKTKIFSIASHSPGNFNK